MEAMEFCCGAPFVLAALVYWISLRSKARITEGQFWAGVVAGITFCSLPVLWLIYYSTFVEGLTQAAAVGDVPRIDALLNRGANPNGYADEFGYPLEQAVLADHPEAAKVLLAHGADPRLRSGVGDVSGRSLVRIAADEKHWDLVKLLEAAGAKP